MAAPVRIAVCDDEEPDDGFEVEFEEKETGTAVIVEDMVNFAMLVVVKSIGMREMAEETLKLTAPDEES